MSYLAQFNNDVHTKEELINFIHTFIDEEGLKRIYTKQSVADIADARILIDKAFEHLKEMYELKPKEKLPTNEAR